MRSPDDTNEFSTLVLKAASDASAWRSVLEAAIRATGAVVGIISLRDLATAELQFPDEASTNLAAPLIVGIAPEHVANYFDHYGAIDPWTDIERKHYPHRPYFMSEHLDLMALRQTEFYAGWLQPQGICECLVAEVYRAERHWVALNLLFDDTALQRRDGILQQVESLLLVMRLGWVLSERMLGLRQQQAASLGYLESWPMPCLVLDEDLVVTAANTHGLQDFSRHAPLTAEISIGAPLALGSCPLRDVLEGLRANANPASGDGMPVRLASSIAGHLLQVTAFAFGQDLVGKQRIQFFISAREDAATPPAAPRTPRIWETEGLTRMQSQVVKWIAEGGTVPNFAIEFGIASGTAYDHLLAGRQKLGGISARDIYTSHQALLKIEGGS